MPQDTDETGFGILDNEGLPIHSHLRNYYEHPEWFEQPDWSKVVIRPEILASKLNF
jgi:hypothetical protein